MHLLRCLFHVRRHKTCHTTIHQPGCTAFLRRASLSTRTSLAERPGRKCSARRQEKVPLCSLPWARLWPSPRRLRQWLPASTLHFLIAMPIGEHRLRMRSSTSRYASRFGLLQLHDRSRSRAPNTRRAECSGWSAGHHDQRCSDSRSRLYAARSVRSNPSFEARPNVMCMGPVRRGSSGTDRTCEPILSIARCVPIYRRVACLCGLR